MAFYGVFMWPFFMVLVYGREKALEKNGRDERRTLKEKGKRVKEKKRLEKEIKQKRKRN